VIFVIIGLHETDFSIELTGETIANVSHRIHAADMLQSFGQLSLNKPLQKSEKRLSNLKRIWYTKERYRLKTTKST